MNENKDRAKESEDNGEAAICPAGEHKDIVFLYERQKEKMASGAKNKPLRLILLILLITVGVGSLSYLLLSLFLDASAPDVAVNAEVSEDVYEGVFSCREAAESCVRSSVSLRLGASDMLGGESVSGVIVSEDGWILSGAPEFKGERGRIYARLYDGEDYAVERVIYDDGSELTLYKISAEGLTAAECREDALGIGEELAVLFSCGEPDYACALAFGVSSHTDRSVAIETSGRKERVDGILQIDVTLGEGGCGAPAFDKNGKLVGISARNELNYFLDTEKISSFLDKIN